MRHIKSPGQVHHWKAKFRGVKPPDFSNYSLDDDYYVVLTNCLILNRMYRGVAAQFLGFGTIQDAVYQGLLEQGVSQGFIQVFKQRATYSPW